MAIALGMKQKLISLLDSFEGTLLDNTGKVKLENLPTTYIQNTFEVSTKANLVNLTTADKNDIAYVTDEDTNYRLKGDDPTVLADWIVQPFVNVSGTPAVGSSYTRTPGAKLPGDTLLDNDDVDITSSYDAGDLSACLHPGTTWKLAIAPGKFLRQRGGNGGSAVGDTQDDQFQGSYFGIVDISTYYLQGKKETTWNTGATGGTGTAQILADEELRTGFQYIEQVADGTNGTPRTGTETRPTNTAGEYWERVA